MSEFLMPSLGADMQEGTVIEWSVKPGDPVKRGDIIGVIRTEKADIEVEVWEDGVIDHLIAKPRAVSVDDGPQGLASMEIVDSDGQRQIVKLMAPLMLAPPAK